MRTRDTGGGKLQVSGRGDRQQVELEDTGKKRSSEGHKMDSIIPKANASVHRDLRKTNAKTLLRSGYTEDDVWG